MWGRWREGCVFARHFRVIVGRNWFGAGRREVIAGLCYEVAAGDYAMTWLGYVVTWRGYVLARFDYDVAR